MENKNKGNENKVIFEDLNCTMDKWVGMVNIKHKGLWQGSRIDRAYTDTKIANNNKINHIMVSSADHYNAISIDRLS